MEKLEEVFGEVNLGVPTQMSRPTTRQAGEDGWTLSNLLSSMVEL